MPVFRFIGMLTITDFIRILEMNYKSPTLEMEELEEHKLSTWKTIRGSTFAPLIPLDDWKNVTAFLG